MFHSQCHTSGCLQGNVLDEHRLGLYFTMAAKMLQLTFSRGLAL